MKFLTLATLCFSMVIIQPGVAHSLDDARALSGLTSVRAIFDVRTGEEKTLQFIFTTIRDTLDATMQQDVKPHYVVSMRGPTVKLLIRSRHGDAELQEKTNKLIGELNQRGVRLEACSYALGSLWPGSGRPDRRDTCGRQQPQLANRLSDQRVCAGADELSL